MAHTRIYIGDEELVAGDPGALERLLGRPLVARDLAEMPALVNLYAVQFETEDHRVVMNVDRINDGWISSEGFFGDEVVLHYFDSHEASVTLAPTLPVKLMTKLTNGATYTYADLKENRMTHPIRLKPADTLSAQIETSGVLHAGSIPADVFLGTEDDDGHVRAAWLQKNEAIQLISNLAHALGAKITSSEMQYSEEHERDVERVKVAIDSTKLETVTVDREMSLDTILAQLAALSATYLKLVEEESSFERLCEKVDEFRALRIGERPAYRTIDLTPEVRKQQIDAYNEHLEFFEQRLKELDEGGA